MTFRLEREFNKEEILALYLNVIFFGQRAYGVGAAAETYFGKQLDQLTLGEAATLARVPQSPSRDNPVTNPQGAANAARTCCGACASSATSTRPPPTRRSDEVVSAKAHRAAGRSRGAVRRRDGARSRSFVASAPQAQKAGYKVYTTLDGRLQAAANRALRVGLVEYDRRHGWRGPTNKVELSGRENRPGVSKRCSTNTAARADLRPALVIAVAEKKRRGLHQGPGPSDHRWAGMSWARAGMPTNSRSGPSPNAPAKCWRAATSSTCCTKRRTRPPNWRRCPRPRARWSRWIRTTARSCRWPAASITSKAAASTTARSGEAPAGIGVQAVPVFRGARGNFTPASVIHDAPIIDGRSRRSRKAGGRRIRRRVLAARRACARRWCGRATWCRSACCVKWVSNRSIEYIEHFGFTVEKNRLPHNLTLALGSMQATPLEMATGFAVFANGGFASSRTSSIASKARAATIVYAARAASRCALNARSRCTRYRMRNGPRTK